MAMLVYQRVFGVPGWRGRGQQLKKGVRIPSVPGIRLQDLQVLAAVRPARPNFKVRGSDLNFLNPTHKSLAYFRLDAFPRLPFLSKLQPCEPFNFALKLRQSVEI
jgi:hypothetical protein